MVSNLPHHSFISLFGELHPSEGQPKYVGFSFGFLTVHPIHKEILIATVLKGSLNLTIYLLHHYPAGLAHPLLPKMRQFVFSHLHFSVCSHQIWVILLKVKSWALLLKTTRQLPFQSRVKASLWPTYPPQAFPCLLSALISTASLVFLLPAEATWASLLFLRHPGQMYTVLSPRPKWLPHFQRSLPKMAQSIGLGWAWRSAF